MLLNKVHFRQAQRNQTQRRQTPIRKALLAAGLLTLGFAAPQPVRAEEDTNPFNSMLGFFGMQADKDEAAIDYRARAPIVLPPKMDLPPPAPSASSRAADWPVDPDVAERRRRAADSHQPAPQVTPNTRVELSAQELSRGRAADVPQDRQSSSDCQAAAGTPICLYAPWDALKTTLGFNKDENIQPGEAPPRKYLTDPPTAYREPTKAVKYVADKPSNRPDAGDAAAYSRDQRHKTSVDDQ